MWGLIGTLSASLTLSVCHGGEAVREPPAAPASGDGDRGDGQVEPASAFEPMPTGRTRPSMLLLDPPPGLRRPPSGDELADARREFRIHCRDLLLVSRSRSGARMVAGILEEAAAAEKDPCVQWVLLEQSIRLGTASGDPRRIESAVDLAADLFLIDPIRAELDALGDIPLRALAPGRAEDVARAAERIAGEIPEERFRDRRTAWTLAADAWKRAGQPSRAKAAGTKAVSPGR